MLINIAGSFDISGMGKHARCVTQALQAVAGIDHQVRSVITHERHAMASLLGGQPVGRQATIAIWGGFEPRWRLALAPLRDLKIAWCVFETDRLADAWVKDLAWFDELWVPSRWGRQVLIQHGFDPARVVVMVEGIDPAIYCPDPISHEGFRFLMVGKYESRKCIDEAVAAFQAAFPDPGQPVALWLKADNPFNSAGLQALRDRIAGDARIHLIEARIDEASMARLYQQADAFLFPSKAEGFGLPCLEAIACGLPVLATDVSGHSEFLADLQGDFLSLPFDRVSIDGVDYRRLYEPFFPDGNLGTWAAPRHDGMVQAMRQAVAQAHVWRARGLARAPAIAARYNWRAIATSALARLQNLL